MPSNRALLWPVLAAIGVPAFLVVVSATPAWLEVLWILWLPSLVIPTAWAVSAFVTLVMAVAALGRRAWGRAASALILPIAVAGAFLNFTEFMHAFMEAGDRLRFALTRSAYLSEVAHLTPSSEPVLVVWNWGGFGVSKGVVYDSSDEILSQHPPPSWQAKADATELGCGYGVEAMGDHLYLASFGC